jgi:hypothetical protein
LPIHVESVVPARFPTWVGRRRFQVVFLGDAPRSAVPLRGLDLQLGADLVGAGWMGRDPSLDEAWWRRHWRTELGPYQAAGTPPVGVWLFGDGLVVGYHPGAPPGSPDEAWAGVRAYLVDRIVLKRSQGDDSRRWTTDSSGAGPVPPPSAPPPPATPVGPYALLEIEPGASDDEVRKAFLRAVKLNHPDRVAHLSTAIQQFARARTQLILEAWSVIKAERRLR